MVYTVDMGIKCTTHSLLSLTDLLSFAFTFKYTVELPAGLIDPHEDAVQVIYLAGTFR